MPERDARLYLTDIIEAIQKVEAYTHGMSFEQFAADAKTVDAVVRNFEVIGEAVKNIPEAIRNKYPAAQWKSAAGMRDHLIHGYFGVSVRMVWETVVADLPAFKPVIQTALRDIA